MTKNLSAREDVIFTDLDDGSAVLLNLETKYYFSLNETGCFLWKLLERAEGASEADLVSQLTTVFDVEADRARTDVTEFVTELTGQRLIKKD